MIFYIAIISGVFILVFLELVKISDTLIKLVEAINTNKESQDEI